MVSSITKVRNFVGDLLKTEPTRVELVKEAAMRARVNWLGGGRSEGDVRLPNWARYTLDLYDIAQLSVVIRTCTYNLRREIFRRGYEWKPKFARKCTNCGIEYDSNVQVCEHCGAETREPNTQETLKADAFFKKHGKRQSLLTVLGQVEDDVNKVDDVFLIFRKEYWQDAYGQIVMEEPIEIVRGSPVFMRIVADDYGNRGGRWWTCLQHRDKVEGKMGFCNECGRILYEVEYISTKSPLSTEPDEYYVAGEVAHFSKYSPSLLNGFPPVLTLWNLAMSLFNQEKYIKTTYDKKRSPTGLVSVVTSNIPSFRKFWDWLVGRGGKLEQDPHYIPFVAVEAAPNARGKIEFIKFMDTLEEMQWTQGRDEMRQRISSLYGVSNVFMADPKAGMGIGNEGLQILVTNRAVEAAQSLYHEHVAPMLEELFNIKDHEWRLKPNEEEDEMGEIQRFGAEIDNATKMHAMGFDVKQGDDGHFEFGGEAKQPMGEGIGAGFGGGFGIPSQVPQQRRFGGEPRSIATKGIPIGQRLPNGELVLLDEDFATKYEGQEGEHEARDEFKEMMRTVFLGHFEELKAVNKDTDVKSYKKKINTVSQAIIEDLKELTEGHYLNIIEEGYKSVQDHFLNKQTVSQDVLRALLQDNIVWKAFEGVGEQLSEKLGDVVKDFMITPEMFNVDKMVEAMKDIADVSINRLETIARTETQAVAMKGRELGFNVYDPQQSWIYKWVGPDDWRTSTQCKEIKARQGKGLHLNELKALIKEVSEKYGGKSWTARDWIAHINCRHGIVRVG